MNIWYRILYVCDISFNTVARITGFYHEGKGLKGLPHESGITWNRLMERSKKHKRGCIVRSNSKLVLHSLKNFISIFHRKILAFYALWRLTLYYVAAQMSRCHIFCKIFYLHQLPKVKYGVRSPKFIWAPCAQLYSLAETPHPPLPPHLGSYTRLLLGSQDRRHFFGKPCLAAFRFWKINTERGTNSGCRLVQKCKNNPLNIRRW